MAVKKIKDMAKYEAAVHESYIKWNYRKKTYVNCKAHSGKWKFRAKAVCFFMKFQFCHRCPEHEFIIHELKLLLKEDFMQEQIQTLVNKFVMDLFNLVGGHMGKVGESLTTTHQKSVETKTDTPPATTQNQQPPDNTQQTQTNSQQAGATTGTPLTDANTTPKDTTTSTQSTPTASGDFSAVMGEKKYDKDKIAKTRTRELEGLFKSLGIEPDTVPEDCHKPSIMRIYFNARFDGMDHNAAWEAMCSKKQPPPKDAGAQTKTQETPPANTQANQATTNQPEGLDSFPTMGIDSSKADQGATGGGFPTMVDPNNQSAQPAQPPDPNEPWSEGKLVKIVDYVKATSNIATEGPLAVFSKVAQLIPFDKRKEAIARYFQNFQSQLKHLEGEWTKVKDSDPTKAQNLASQATQMIGDMNKHYEKMGCGKVCMSCTEQLTVGCLSQMAGNEEDGFKDIQNTFKGI
jgi:hypothetical protein